MKIDLDELERDNTQAATELDASWLREQAQMNNCHLLSDVSGELIVNSPPVTLALIARIREMESVFAGWLQAFDAAPWPRGSQETEMAVEMRLLLEKGVVLP